MVKRNGYKDILVLSAVGLLSHTSAIFALTAEQICEVRAMNEEYLIGIFGTMCDYMKSDNCKNCPFADTKDQFEECDPWREIYDIRLSRD